MSELLQRELQTYEINKADLLKRGENRFVLIREDSIAGLFDTEADAVTSGYQTYGNVPFLVRHVVRKERPVVFISHLLIPS